MLNFFGFAVNDSKSHETGTDEITHDCDDPVQVTEDKMQIPQVLIKQHPIRVKRIKTYDHTRPSGK